MQTLTRSYPPKAPLWQGLLFMSLLCALFYAAMNYYAGNVLDNIGDLQTLSAVGQQMGLAAYQRVMAVRALFSVLFCVLLGVLGWRVTGRLWPAALVHTAGVLIMLWEAIPQDMLLENWWLALCIAAVVGLITLGGTAWGRMKAKLAQPRLLR